MHINTYIKLHIRYSIPNAVVLLYYSLQVVFLSVESIGEWSLISVVKVMNSNSFRYSSFLSC